MADGFLLLFGGGQTDCGGSFLGKVAAPHAFRQFLRIGNRNSGGRWFALRCCGFGIYRLVTMGIASSAACACRLFMCAVQPNGSLFLSGAGLLTSSFVMVCSTCSQ